jgi:hypothetical protein
MSNMVRPSRGARAFMGRVAADIFKRSYVFGGKASRLRPMRPLAVVALWLALAAPAAAQQMTLLMIEQHGCVYCARWDAEVGDAYARTEEGRRAPLRRIDLHEPWPEDLSHVRRERLTPSFILLRDGVEVGRMVGYAGEDFFWALLGEMLAREPAG